MGYDGRVLVKPFIPNESCNIEDEYREKEHQRDG